MGMGVRLVPVIVALSAATVACGAGDGASSTTLLPAADIVVRDWLDAVDTGDVTSLEDLVAAESLAFVVGVESRLAPDQITAFADDGLPNELVAGYWASFEEAFDAIDGNDIVAFDVGAVEEFDAAGARFAAVTVGIEDRSTDVIVRRNAAGGWQIDVLATVGGGFTRQLTELASRATEDRFRTLFEQWVLPALEAAARNDVDGVLFESVRQVHIAFDAARR
jgi:hypothetical protein